MTVQAYVRESYHSRIRAPVNCPNCESAFSLEALGYYSRNVSGLGKYHVHRILVRRFRCRVCPVTVSLLPCFCQPYRLICNQTIESYMGGGVCHPEVVYWLDLLQSYKRRFAQWLSEFSLVIGNGLGVAPSIRDPVQWWRHIIKACGRLEAATCWIVKTFKVCLFGRYRCNQKKESYHVAGGTGRQK